MPRATKLKLGTGCYMITSPTGRGCSSTRVYWRDGNRDGKVQPRAELRAVCLEEKQMAFLKASPTRCN